MSDAYETAQKSLERTSTLAKLSYDLRLDASTIGVHAVLLDIVAEEAEKLREALNHLVKPT
jgi:hypothetical protein